jgi:hypothetical protein
MSEPWTVIANNHDYTIHTHSGEDNIAGLGGAGYLELRAKYMGVSHITEYVWQAQSWFGGFCQLDRRSIEAI